MIKTLEELIADIYKKNKKYKENAYLLIFEVLDRYHTILTLEGRVDAKTRHLNAKGLYREIILYAIDKYGLLAGHVLESFGLTNAYDIGELIGIMIDNRLLIKGDNDSIDDFKALGDAPFHHVLKPYYAVYLDTTIVKKQSFQS